MKRINRTDAELEQVCVRLLNCEYDEVAYPLSIDELKRLYAILIELRHNQVPHTIVVNLGWEAFIQFSDISPQHFLITSTQSFSQQDFEFVPVKKWYGPCERMNSFPGFLITELSLNRWSLFGIFVLSFVLLWGAHDDGLYDMISNLLIQSGTVFLSIYLIFTVTQSQILQSDQRLFKKGVLQRYHRDDRNVTILAILTLALTFVNTMFAHLNQTFNPTVSIATITLDRHLWLALTTSFTICLLFDTFLAVVNYYLERTKAVLERNLLAGVLEEDFQEHYRDKESL